MEANLVHSHLKVNVLRFSIPMKSSFHRLFQTSLLADYGMLVVLVLVCICLSWATIRKGDIIAGEVGGRELGEKAAAVVPEGRFIVSSPADAAAAETLPDLDTTVETLRKQGCEVVATVTPANSLPAFRREARRLLSEHSDIDAFVLVDPHHERWLLSALRGAEIEKRPEIIPPVQGKESIFLKRENLINIVRQASIIAIIAAGMTMVIITGGIDLSVGSLVAFSGVVTALCLKQAGGIPLWGLTFLVLAIGGSGGLGLGAAFGGLARWTFVGLAVATGFVLAMVAFAETRVLGITPLPHETAQSILSAVEKQGSLFLIHDHEKPGIEQFVEQVRKELQQQQGIRIIGERSASAGSQEGAALSVEDRAKDLAEQAIAEHPDLDVLFGTDRDIVSGLSRAIDAAGETERIVAVGPVTDKTGLIVFAVLSGIVVGCAAGTFSGVVITGFSIPPFIATLAMMLIARGIARYLCKGVPIWDLPEAFEFLGNGYLLEGTLGSILPVPVAVMILVFLIGHITLSRTKFGRYLYAVGGNEEATRLSGIPINAVKLSAYVITGGLSAVAGIIMAARLQCGHPETGMLYELYVIAACVVGGCSLMGGQGKILGSLIGALLIWVIFNGLNLLNVDSYLQQAFLGLVIFIAVLLDQAKKRLST